MTALRLIEHPSVRPDKANFKCSFCFKSRQDVRHLIADIGNARICNECVELCVDIIEAESVERP